MASSTLECMDLPRRTGEYETGLGLYGVLEPGFNSLEEREIFVVHARGLTGAFTVSRGGAIES